MRISLRTALVFGFGGLVLIAVAGVLFLGARGARQNTDDLLAEAAQALVNSMVRAIEEELEPVLDQAVWVSEQFATGRVRLENPAILDAFALGVMAATPDVSGVSIVDRGGQERRYMRDAPAVELVDLSGKPKAMKALADASTRHGAFWGPPLWAGSLNSTLINLRTPLFQDGRYLGLLIQGLELAAVSETLPKPSGGFPFTPFVIYDRHWVLAHPNLAREGQEASDEHPLAALAAFGDPILSRIWSPGRPLNLPGHGETYNGSVVNVDGRDYAFLYQTLHGHADRPLTVGLYLDLTEGMNQLVWKRLERIVVFGLGILVISLFAAVLVARAIGKPIVRLADAATFVGHGRLDGVPALPPTRVTELDAAADAFRHMVAGLKERRLIRSLLGTYVPEGVADRLIENQGALEPVCTEASVLFTDIAGFTTLSEKLAPAEIVTLLNSYFSVLERIIDRHGGIITQFQGDAVLAVFNVPEKNPQHAAQAIVAATEILHVLETKRFGGHRLPTRIGVTTGELTAGSVGAGGRLSYTVYGDMVNLAARLQEMNKQFGTSILVNARAAEHAGGYTFREVGTIDVRGKTEPVRVLTIDLA